MRLGGFCSSVEGLYVSERRLTACGSLLGCLASKGGVEDTVVTPCLELSPRTCGAEAVCRSRVSPTCPRNMRVPCHSPKFLGLPVPPQVSPL